jgi:hypothetical protein
MVASESIVFRAIFNMAAQRVQLNLPLISSKPSHIGNRKPQSSVEENALIATLSIYRNYPLSRGLQNWIGQTVDVTVLGESAALTQNVLLVDNNRRTSDRYRRHERTDVAQVHYHQHR